MSAWYAPLLSALLDPHVVLPILLLTAAVVLWLAARPAREPRTSGWEPAPAEPDRDEVSRSYLPLARGEYSPVLRTAYWRLDAACAARTGRTLRQIPWRRRSRAKLPVPDPEGLLAARLALDALELWAVQLEAGSWVRRDFWRSRWASREALLQRIDPALDLVDRQLTLLEVAP